VQVVHTPADGPHVPDVRVQVLLADREPAFVTGWLRLDDAPASSTVQVYLEARARRDLRLPLLSAVQLCVLTLDPDDQVRVLLDGPGWSAGAVLCGVRTVERGAPGAG
jgi:hypothetical protein